MYPDSPTTRDQELRRMLVATASAAPAAPQRGTGRVVLAALGAFVLAGAATGGAVSAAALYAPASTPTTVSVAEMSHALVYDDTQLYGTPVVLTGQGDTIADIGAVPDGARQIAVAVHCIDAGTFELLVDGRSQGNLTCDETATEYTNGGAFYDVDGPGTHTLQISADGSDRYVVWASWASQAVPPEASTTQAGALADGTVTETEYRDGFARYQACLEAEGYSVVFIDDTSTIITYSNTDAAVSSGAEGRCYTKEFQQLDMEWQLAHAYDSETYIAFRGCLEAAGITPAPDAPGVWQQLQDADISPIACTTGLGE